MKIIIYTTKACPWCNVVKDYLTYKGAQYEEYNIQENNEKEVEMVEKSGQTNVPVIDIDGKIIVGFDQETIDTCLHEQASEE